VRNNNVKLSGNRITQWDWISCIDKSRGIAVTISNTTDN
jgi:hypothetical protein